MLNYVTAGKQTKSYFTLWWFT